MPTVAKFADLEITQVRNLEFERPAIRQSWTNLDAWHGSQEGEDFAESIRHSNVVLEVVLKLAGREEILAGKALFAARNTLADMLAQIDSWVNGAGRSK